MNYNLMFGFIVFLLLIVGLSVASNELYVIGEGNFTGNVTTEGIILENDLVNHRMYDNSTCVIITGDTSTLTIC